MTHHDPPWSTMTHHDPPRPTVVHQMRPMATHWHRPVRMVLLETLNELVRRHAAAVSAWLGRAQVRLFQTTTAAT